MKVARAVVAALGAALIFGCGDATGPVGRRVQLGIVPVFAGAEGLLGVGSDVDSFVVTVSNPPAPDYDTSIVIPPGQDSIALLIQVLVSEAEDTITVQFSGYSSATGLLLYQGSQSLTVKAGVSGEQVPVTASYVGPGAGIDSVIVNPDAAALLVGQSITLGYTGYDSDAPLVDDSVPVRWASLDTALAVVTGDGAVTGRATGTARIVVTSVARSALKDTATITVAEDVAQPVLALSATSAAFTWAAGAALPSGQTISITNAGTGTLSGLSVGAVTYVGGSGWLTVDLSGTTAPATLTVGLTSVPTTAGTYSASFPVSATGATGSPQTVSVTLTVTPGAAAVLVVTPGFGVVRPTQTQALTLVARDAFNNVVPTGSATYVSRTPVAATVSAGGVVTGVASGAAVIVATLGGVSDSTVIAVAGNNATVVSAIADGRAFRTAAVGDTVRVLVAAELSGISPEKLGSYNAQLNWGTTALRYVRSETVAGGFTAPVLNETLTSSGQLRFGAADANGAAGPSVGLVRVVFVANASGATGLTLAVTELSASGTLVNLLQSPYAATPVLGSQVRVP